MRNYMVGSGPRSLDVRWLQLTMLSTRLQPPVEYTRIIINYLEKGDERRALLRLAAARPQIFLIRGGSGRATRRGHITSQSGTEVRDSTESTRHQVTASRKHTVRLP